MTGDNNWLFWLFLIGGSVLFLYVPQLMARRRQKKREDSLVAGDKVITIGGFIGILESIDFEKNLARLRLADNLVVDILPSAIGGKRADEPTLESVEKETDED